MYPIAQVVGIISLGMILGSFLARFLMKTEEGRNASLGLLVIFLLMGVTSLVVMSNTEEAYYMEQGRNRAIAYLQDFYEAEKNSFTVTLADVNTNKDCVERNESNQDCIKWRMHYQVRNAHGVQVAFGDVVFDVEGNLAVETGKESETN